MNSLVVFVFAQFVFCSINFFATGNPYTALHGGAVSSMADSIDNEMAIHQVFLVSLAIAISYFVACSAQVRIGVIPSIWGVALLISGIFTGILFLKPQTYFVDFISITAASAMAGRESLRPNSSLTALFWLMIFVTVAGFFLALLRPEIWGYLPFSYSRDDRGEDTYATMMGASTLLPPLALSVSGVRLFIRYSAFLIAAVVSISTATRTHIALTFFPLLIYLAVVRRVWYARALVVILLAAISLNWQALSDIFILHQNGLSTVESTLTGRLALWQFYWNKFIEAPIFGNGAFLLQRADTYQGYAKSEIGILKTAAEYGIISAFIQAAIVICAAVAAFEIMKTKSKDPMSLFVSLSFISAIPNFVLQAGSRILTTEDFVFWFGAFWLMYRHWPKLLTEGVIKFARR